MQSVHGKHNRLPRESKSLKEQNDYVAASSDG